MPAPIIPIVQPDDDEEEVSAPSSPLVQRGSAAQGDTGNAQPPAASSAQPNVNAQVAGGQQPQSIPQAPSIPQFDQNKYEQLLAQKKQYDAPVNPSDPSVKPKWYDRLAGALVGFGVGYREGPTAGIQAGGAVTNRRYEQAEAQRQANERAAEQALSDYQNEYNTQLQQFGAQSRGYENTLEGQRTANDINQQAWDRNFRTQQADRQQSNEDRGFNYQRQRDQQRDTEWNQDYNLRRTDADRDYQLNRARVGIESARERREEADEKIRNGMTPASQLRLRTQANQLDQRRQKNYDILENGDPRQGIPGYRQQLKNLQNPKARNPDTGKPYTDQERQQALAQLNADHAKAKQQIEDDYAAQMNTLGIPVQRVLYDNEGNVVRSPDSNSRQQANAAPAQQTRPRVKVGDPVNVGGRPAIVTGFNPKTGKPKVSYVE